MNEPTKQQPEKPAKYKILWLLLQGGVHIFVFWMVLTNVTLSGPNLNDFAADFHTKLPWIIQQLLNLSMQRTICYSIFVAVVIIDIAVLVFLRVIRPNRWLLRLWVSCIWIVILTLLGLLFAAYYITIRDLAF